MKKRHLILLLGLLAVLSVFTWGCAGKMAEPERIYILESHWGKSFESAKNNQILNPEAGKNLEPVMGLDGQAANENMKKYRKGFEKEPPAQVYNLNLGSIGGSGRR